MGAIHHDPASHKSAGKIGLISNWASGTPSLLPSGLVIEGCNLHRDGDHIMAWETPAFEEIEMNAEIGSYQGDYDDRDYNGL